MDETCRLCFIAARWVIVNLVLEDKSRAAVEGNDPGPTLERTALGTQPVGFVLIAVVAEERMSSHQQHRTALATDDHLQIQRKLGLGFVVIVVVFVVDGANGANLVLFVHDQSDPCQSRRFETKKGKKVG